MGAHLSAWSGERSREGAREGVRDSRRREWRQEGWIPSGGMRGGKGWVGLEGLTVLVLFVTMTITIVRMANYPPHEPSMMQQFKPKQFNVELCLHM